MGIPEIRYATTPDGIDFAYRGVGDGLTDDAPRRSASVEDLVAGSGLRFEDAGEHELKGVPDSWHLYRVVGA